MQSGPGKDSNRCRSKSPKRRGSSRFPRSGWRPGPLPAARSRRAAGRAPPRRRAPWLPFCACCLSKFLRSRRAARRSRTRPLRTSEAGYRAAELGESRRRARIEYDPRSEREGKSGRRYRRQGYLGRVDRGRKGRQYAVDCVIRDALLGGMVDRRDALAAALGHDQTALEVRQRMHLRRLLGKYQRGGDEQMTQGAVHVTADITGRSGGKSTTIPLKKFL